MALTTAQQALLLFKKWLGLGQTTASREFFNETAYPGRVAVYTNQIWTQADLIPNTAPVLTSGQTSGVVQYWQNAPLTAAPGTTNAFTSSLLIDAIPFNYGDGTSYNYTIRDSVGTTIPFGQGDWIVDTDAGLVTFYSTVPANMPPTISFYKYVGTKGFTSSSVSLTGSLSGTASNAVSASFATTSSAATSITFIPTTASFAVTSSFAISASWAPGASGTVTSITAGDGLTGGTITSAGTITLNTASVHFLDGVKNELNTEGVISSSAQVSYTQLQNIPTGIVSSSGQVAILLPSGVVSSSVQINTGSFSGSFTGNFIGTSSWANNAISASYVPPSFIDNLVTVGLAGSDTDFTSIKSAVDSITDASAVNTYTVRVYPGVYIEDTITLKPYIAVKGDSSISTIVSASSPSSSIFIMADQTMVIDMGIQGSTGTNASAVVYSSPTTPQTNAIAYVENVRFGTNYTNAKVVGSGSSGNCILQCSNVKYGGFTSGSKSFDVGFYVTSGSDGGIGRMQLRNVTSTNGGVAGTDDNQIFALADAPGCTFIVNGCLLTRATGTARGTGFKVYNGGQLRLTGVNFQRWTRGIWAPQTGSAPSIDAIALNFENCTTDVAIEHSGSLGKVQGTDNFLKTQINFSSSLYEVGKDARRIRVAKKGGDFSSISASVAYITDSSETNRYVIEVGPGQYTEKTIDLTGKPYVSIVGSNIQTTQIFASSSAQHIVKMGINNEISFLTLANAGSGYAAIYVDDVGDFAQAHKISIYDSDIGVQVVSRTQDTQFYGEYIDINGPFSYGTYVSASNNALCLVNMENYYLFPSASTSIGNYVTHPSASLSMHSATFQGDNTANSVAIQLESGAQIEGSGLDIQDWDYGIKIPNVGTGPNFRLVGTMIHGSSTYDIDNLNATTRGRFQGVSNHTLINNVSQDLYWNFLDDEYGENDVTRKLSVTFADGTHTDATTLIFKGSSMGVLEGGTITTSSGFTVTTAAGYGYLNDPVDPTVFKRFDWVDSNITLTANSTNYLFIDSTGTLTSAPSSPNFAQNIILGRVVTNDTGVEFIDQSGWNAEHTANRLSKFTREALGPVFADGGIVSEDVVPFRLDVTAGNYYFAENNFLSSGTSSINLTQYYPSASTWARYTSSVVPNNTYASSSQLAPMSASAYTKHTVYLVGAGVDEKYFLVINSNQYDTLVQAENAALPTIPTYFDDGVVPLAAVYVQSGSANITQIQDIRPIIGFRAAGVNASSVHGNLLGLNADDHPQYLLVNGTRAMAGNLSMGGNNITNVGTLIGTASWASNANNADLLDGLDSTVFAITGSNTFNGNQTINGTLVVSGSATSSLRLDANRLVVSSSASFNAQIAGTHAVFSQMYNENSTVAGLYLGRNTQDNTPRVGFFNGTTAQNWQIDNASGQFRWYTPSVTRMTLTTSGASTVLRLLGSGSVITSEGSISASNGITGSLFGTSSWATNSISSSVAVSASWAPTILPTGVISSSTQVVSALPVGTVSSSTQISYTQLQNIPNGIVSSSIQVTSLLPSGVVSSSLQINTGSFSGSFTGNFIGTSSWANNSTSASFATTSSAATSITFVPATASFAPTASFVNILNQNVSASGNIEAGTNLRSNYSVGDEGGEINLARPQTNSSISGSVVIDVNGNRVRIFEAELPNRGGYWDITSLASGVGTNLAGGAGTVTSITAGDGLTGGTITGAGTITLNTSSVHFLDGVKNELNTEGVISSSAQVSYTQLQNIPTGIVSSSTQVALLLPIGTVSSSLQINTGSFSGSFTGTLFGTSSWAQTSSLSVSSSFATSASWAPSAQSSPFPFTGSASISGSLLISGTVSNALTVLAASNPTITIQGNTSPTLNIQGNGGTGSFTVGADVNIGAVTNNTLGFLQNNTVAWYINTNKAFIPNVNNSYDIGLTGTRVRTVWATNISSSNPISSASFAATASYALNAGGSGFPYDGTVTPAVISGSLIISGSTTQGLFVTGSTNFRDGLTVNGGTLVVTATTNRTTVSGSLAVTGSTDILGNFTATTKSFKIDHQRLPGKSLVYGVLEGPEHAVYARGRVQSTVIGTAVIQLPEDWEWLVDESSMTVQLTPIDGPQELYVHNIENNTVTIKSKSAIDCFYLIHATRKDVAPLITVE